MKEVENEKEKLEYQIERMLLEDNEMKKHISDLEYHLDVANQNIHPLKSYKLESEKKVSAMTNLQLDLEVSEKKLNAATLGISHLAKECDLLEQQLSGFQDFIMCKDLNY